MTVYEVLETIILPIIGAVGGISAVIVFALSKNQRDAQIRLLDSQGNEIQALTPAKLQQMIMESAEKVLAAQSELIEDLREHVKRSDMDISQLKTQLELEIGSREEIIKELKLKLARYQEENALLREDNKKLNEKIAKQQAEINELKIKIAEIVKRQCKDQKDG
jgi:regulator of replication initiation timing